jgi:hypothetical protein
VCCVEHLRCSALEFYDYLVCSVHSNSISPYAYYSKYIIFLLFKYRYGKDHT